MKANNQSPNSGTQPELQTQMTQMQQLLTALTVSQQQTNQFLQTLVAQNAAMAQQPPQQPSQGAQQPPQQQPQSAQPTPSQTQGAHPPPSQPPTGNATNHPLFQRMQMPRISKIHPENSFMQLECWMDNNQMTSDKHRFDTLKLAIESETTGHVQGLIDNPPSTEQYSTLKKAIIKLYSESQELRLRKLLSKTSMVNTKPSLILSEMRQLYPNGGESEIFRTIYLERLPPRIRNAVNSLKLVVPNASSLTLDLVAEYADQQMESTDDDPVHAVRSAPKANDLEEIVERICQKFFSQRTQSRGRSKNRNQNWQPERNTSNAPQQSEGATGGSNRQPCYYHKKFGNNRHENKQCYDNCPLHAEWERIRNQREQEKPHTGN